VHQVCETPGDSIREGEARAEACRDVAASMRRAAVTCGGISTSWGREWNRLASHLERRAAEESLLEAATPEADRLRLVR
jgi:hypothetical protein